ncbi:MAG: folate-binding protein YgfZ [Rhizobiales bacterium]|nr:folate-binding protein YgfZ [Hyphomicrobiales bacterium]
MQAALLPERGVVKVAGEDARRFLNGLATNDIAKLAPGQARFAALLTPQGKIIVDFIVVEAAPEDGGGFFLDCPCVLAPALVEKLNFYRLRAKVTVEDLSQSLGVMALWPGSADSEYGLCYADPRHPGLGTRIMLPPQLATEAAADLGASLTDADAYDMHRIALGVPRGGTDFIYGDTFPHEADMDQLSGVDFDKGCYIGQEVVSRVEHRATARSRVVPIAYDEYSPMPGIPVMAGDKQIGMLGSTAKGRGLALLRLDRVADALAAGTQLTAGGIAIRVVKPAWARFAWPGESKAAS